MHFCAFPGVPLAVINSTPVRIHVHMLVIPLYQHSSTICAVNSSNGNKLKSLASIFIYKGYEVGGCQGRACVVGVTKAWWEVTCHAPVRRVIPDVDQSLVRDSKIIPREQELVLVPGIVVIKRLVLVKIFVSQRKRFYESPCFSSLGTEITVCLNCLTGADNQVINTWIRAWFNPHDSLARFDSRVKYLAASSLVMLWACASVLFFNTIAFFNALSPIQTRIGFAASV